LKNLFKKLGIWKNGQVDVGSMDAKSGLQQWNQLRLGLEF